MIGLVSPSMMYWLAGIFFFISLLFMVAVKKFINSQDWPDAILCGIISVLVMVFAAVVFIGSYVLFASHEMCGI